jgi:hypothetical protein
MIMARATDRARRNSCDTGNFLWYSLPAMNAAQGMGKIFTRANRDCGPAPVTTGFMNPGCGRKRLLEQNQKIWL